MVMQYKLLKLHFAVLIFALLVFYTSCVHAKDISAFEGKLFCPEQRVQIDLFSENSTQISIVEAQCDSFEAAQWKILLGSQRVFSRISESFANGPEDDAISQIEKKRRSLNEEYKKQFQLRETLFSRIREVGISQKIDGLNKKIQDLSAEITQTNSNLFRNFPAYAELAIPQPIGANEVKAILKPDETLVLVTTNSEATYVWLINQKIFRWYQVKGYDYVALANAVEKLRLSLEAATITRSTPDYKKRDSYNADNGQVPFEAQLAFEIYHSIFSPIEDVLPVGSKVLFVGNGPLASIPLNVLVTKKPENGIDYTEPENLRELNWFIDRNQILVLPTISSLKSLRCYYQKPEFGIDICGASQTNSNGNQINTTKQIDFLGIGAPVFGKSNINALNSERGSTGEPVNQSTKISQRINSLPELLGAKFELESIVASFGMQNNARILIGSDATETAVKGINSNGSEIIKSARFLSFATHGILNDDAIFDEPGLALSPPASANQFDDGFLSASEVSKLRLSSQFVALSACNTAMENNQNSNGIVGLGSAFFYAGAQSLMVSHWSVDDAATAFLMSKTFGKLGTQPDANKVDAFYKSVNELRNFENNPKWTHPYYWGAFSILGVGQ
jgi:CHAT domain-containing protein